LTDVSEVLTASIIRAIAVPDTQRNIPEDRYLLTYGYIRARERERKEREK
jgi:hypothetical protein